MKGISQDKYKLLSSEELASLLHERNTHLAESQSYCKRLFNFFKKPDNSLLLKKRERDPDLEIPQSKLSLSYLSREPIIQVQVVNVQINKKEVSVKPDYLNDITTSILEVSASLVALSAIVAFIPQITKKVNSKHFAVLIVCIGLVNMIVYFIRHRSQFIERKKMQIANECYTALQGNFFVSIINGEDDGLIDIESFVEEYAEKKSLKDEGIKESILEYIKVEIQYVFTLEEIIVINEGNKKTYWRLKNRLNKLNILE